MAQFDTMVGLPSISWQWLIPAFCYQTRFFSFLISTAAGQYDNVLYEVFLSEGNWMKFLRVNVFHIFSAVEFHHPVEKRQGLTPANEITRNVYLLFSFFLFSFFLFFLIFSFFFLSIYFFLFFFFLNKRRSWVFCKGKLKVLKVTEITVVQCGNKTLHLGKIVTNYLC